MDRPYIICHMMMSLDGRIDCGMTEELPGDEYYEILDSLNAPTRLSGRVTAELEMALPGKFVSKDKSPIGKEIFHKAKSADGYEVVIDTKGTLLWEDQENEKRPVLVITSEKASKEYLDYLADRHVSWIASGKEHVDLRRSMEILKHSFNVERAALVGGGHINASFLNEGLLDEISILIGAGIDGRANMSSVFDGLPNDKHVTTLKLKSVQAYESGAIWVRYKTH